MKKLFAFFVPVLLILAGCNNSNNETGIEKFKAKETTTDTDPNLAVVVLNGDDNMTFDLKEIRVKEGQVVKLTLNHTGKAPLMAMGHNFVLLAQGTSFSEFSMAAMSAKDNDYIPKDMAASVIAYTKTIGGGESDSIEFPAPPKGEYDFLCSFPGHSGMMKGKFIVE
ncbi:plastocyanin/azurin family copper-binding protein [Polluticaenibacter yanchengensis]|uniref:Azurin n=1 Tax=Polluticaenibacter yanchengensis TaxID=3014562 RepID=A0ABT4UGK8_9BACT|nr:azurin [Chitinophagaceae bacterium LY-5]